MKKYFSSVLIAVLMIAGLGLILYPVISDQRNRSEASVLIVEYNDEVKAKTEAEWNMMLQNAYDYNTRLLEGSIQPDAEGHVEGYSNELDVTGTGIMGYLDIEKIGVELPIYHGTDNGVLQIGVGHVEFSSLPVGGPSTHCVLSGHRGLPSATLFTDLPELEIGDEFTVTVLGQVFTYRVDQIETVLPEEVDDLSIVEGKDYCTLVTCTPYGINSHRLLVRGERVTEQENQSGVLITNEGIQIEPFVVAVFMTIIILLGINIYIALSGNNNNSGKKNSSKKGGK